MNWIKAILWCSIYIIVYSQSKSICKVVALTCGHLGITWKNNKTSLINTWIGLKPESCKRRLGTGSCFALVLVVIWLFLTFIKVLSSFVSGIQTKTGRRDGLWKWCVRNGVWGSSFYGISSPRQPRPSFFNIHGLPHILWVFFISLTHLAEHIQRFHWDEVNFIHINNFFTPVTLSHS